MTKEIVRIGLSDLECIIGIQLSPSLGKYTEHQCMNIIRTTAYEYWEGEGDTLLETSKAIITRDQNAREYFYRFVSNDDIDKADYGDPTWCVSANERRAYLESLLD